MSRLALFLCISTFSGSMVLMGARDLRAALQDPSAEDIERSKRLIQQLRGDELFRVQAKYTESSDKPPRKRGSVLPEYDLAKIKKLLFSMIGGNDEGG
jgi:hypothetical protein